MNEKLYKMLAIFVLVCSVALGGLWMDYRSTMTNPLRLPEEGQLIQVEPGTALSTVIYRLAKEGIITHPRYLLWSAKLRGSAASMKAGEYQLEHGLTAEGLLDKLFSGKVTQYSLTVVEGWTFRQMLQLLKDHPHISHTLTTESDEEIMGKLGYTGQHPEGRFLPDTYLFPRGMSDISFLKRAYQSMESYISQAWEQRATGLPYRDRYEALIMASIVEKETGQPGERQQIAGVFVRRLEKGMRLQTDPTIIYGMGEAYKGDIRFRDLKADTPYNTYTRFGLPPTPIALPGKDAIYAALHPDEGKSLYFVARGDGSHVFSETYAEHDKAVCKYQKKGRNCNSQ